NATGFWRHARGIRDTGRQSRAGPAVCLLVPESADLVAGRRLPGETHADVLRLPVVVGLVVQIRVVQPLGRVAGVQGVVDVRSLPRTALCPSVHEVPQAINLDRTADRTVEVVHAGQRNGRGEALGFQLVRVVVGLERLAAAGIREGTGGFVAAGFRDDVH